LQIFGPPCLKNAAGHVMATGKRAGGILVYLALAHDRKATRERLSSLFWWDRGSAQARASLRQSLLDLRASLAPGSPDPLVADRNSIALDAAHVQTDLELAEAAGSAAALLAILQQIGSKPPLDTATFGDAFDQWCTTMMPLVEGRLRAALLKQLDGARTAEDHATVIALAEAWAVRDPTDQIVAEHAITAEIRTGNRNAAERRFRQLSYLLDRDRGTAPDPALAALLQESRAIGPVANTGRLRDDQPPGIPAPPPAAREAPPAWRRRWTIAAFAAVPATLAIAAITMNRLNGPAPISPVPAVAVLPFQAEGGDRADEVLAAGISEEVMNGLAEDARLRVIGRATAARLNETATLRNTAQGGLGVSKFLMGKVSKGADRSGLTVSVQLVDSRTRQTDWETIVRLAETDIASAGDTLVGQVARQLLGDAGGRRSAVRPVKLDPTAYRRIVQARQHVQSREGNRLIEARELALQASEIAPQWAEAHAVRSIAASLMQNYTNVPMGPLQAEAGAAAAQALALDPQLPAAHEAQSLALEGTDANKAMVAAGRAVLLRPGSAEARRRLAWLLRADGQYRQAASELEMAIRIDPLWYLPYVDLGISLAQTNEPARLIAWQARHSALNPPAGERELVLANMLLDTGRAGQAAAIAARLVSTEPGLTYAALTRVDALVALYAAADVPSEQLELNMSPAMMALAQGQIAKAARMADRNAAGGWDNPETQVVTGYSLMTEARPGQLRALHTARFPTPAAYGRSPAQVLALGRHPGLYPSLAFEAVGDPAAARAIRSKVARDVARLEQLGLSMSQSGLTVAALALMEGRRSRSLDRLEATLSAQWPVVCHGPIWIGTDPLFRALAGEPRFAALLVRCKDRLNSQRAAAGLAPLSLAGQLLKQAGAGVSKAASAAVGAK
jgi:DNA-binding SARP family transcriptional activator/TolB-like protein